MKKIIWLSLVLMLGSCIPATAVSQTLPDGFVTFTPTFTVTPVLPAKSPTPIQVVPTETAATLSSEQYLSEIHMMTEREGWAWAAIASLGKFTLLHTTDGGISWNNVMPNENSGYAFFLDGKVAWVQVFDASTNSIVALMQTVDGGETWKTVNQDLGILGHTPFLDSFSFQDEMMGWWRTGDGSAGSSHMYYYRTKNAGITWDLVIIKAPKGFGEDYYFTDEASGEIVICHVCYNHFYFDLRRVIFSPEELPTLLVTNDFGKTWNQAELPEFPSNVYLDDMRFNSPMFFNEKEGVLPILVRDFSSDTVEIHIYGTQDNGLTWSLESEPTIVNQFGKRGADIQFISRLDGFLTHRMICPLLMMAEKHGG